MAVPVTQISAPTVKLSEVGFDTLTVPVATMLLPELPSATLLAERLIENSCWGVVCALTAKFGAASNDSRNDANNRP